MKSILFITTSSLAANPRLVKEFEALKENNNCVVLSFKHDDWSLELSEAIKKRNPKVEFFEIDRKKDVFQTIASKAIHKIAISLNGIFSEKFKICAFASSDKALQLWFKAKVLQNKIQFSRIIAHNLGAFFSAVNIAEKLNIELQLDIEDYYPGEALYFNEKYEIQNRMEIMKHSFSKADAITYASRGIQLECEKHFKVQTDARQITIINAFNEEDFIEPDTKPKDKIHCVWFSQHIGPNRGLEQVFEAAKTLDHVTFHIVGNRNQAYLDGFDLGDNIRFYKVMKQELLHSFLSKMDIGLALENTEADYNRNICLTNKFLAYSQAGLYIVASNTLGQSQFLKSLDYDAGVIIESSLKETLFKFNQVLLEAPRKTDRWLKAKSFCWEIEKIKLKELLS